MQVARNVTITALLALGVTVLPAGGAVAATALAALNMAFLAVLGLLVYRLHRENSFAVMTLSDGWRALLYGALGAIVLLIAWFDEAWAAQGGGLAWLAAMAVAVVALVRVVRETQSGYA